jgi:hypothetical protein
VVEVVNGGNLDDWMGQEKRISDLDGSDRSYPKGR